MGTSVLYSSEILFYFQPDRMRSLHATLAQHGVRLRTITYVRDVAGHALSGYAQVVKREGYTDPLETYLEGYGQWPEDTSMRPHLELLIETIGRDNTLVGHYDEVRKNLFESFMAQAFDQTNLTGFDLAAEEVNRSLTAQELEWMRSINSRLDTLLGALVVSDQIIRRGPLDPAGLSMTVGELAMLDGRFGREVAWINDAFPGTRLRVNGGAAIVDERCAHPEPSAQEHFLLECLADVVNATSKPRAPRASGETKAAEIEGTTFTLAKHTSSRARNAAGRKSLARKAVSRRQPPAGSLTRLRRRVTRKIRRWRRQRAQQRQQRQPYARSAGYSVLRRRSTSWSFCSGAGPSPWSSVGILSTPWRIAVPSHPARGTS